MSALENVDSADLRSWLDHVETKESTERLMMAIAHSEGADLGDLTGWYDVSADELREWFSKLNTEPMVTAIAETEGIDMADLADRYGVSERTVRDWFRELETESVDDAVTLINRYSRERSLPEFRETRSRVEYIDYEVLEANDWSIEDDVFEKASDLDLDGDQYGRIVVEPGESILEGAENRGFYWPFACRAGACSNCAVIVKEGDIAMPGNNVLTDEQVTLVNARLTCVGVPVTDEVKLVKNVQHLEQFDDLRLPSPFHRS